MTKEVIVKDTPASVQDWTHDQIKLITDTVAKNASPEELKLFLYRCKNMGLDPLKPGQIYFIKYNPSSPGTMVVGIDGFRSIADRSGKHTGTVRGILRDDKGKCIGAWAEVHRSDWKHPAREEVSLHEYHTGKSQWVKMPETMIKKVAEVAALRMAFPDELGGLYSQEEMEQAGHNETHAASPKGQWLGTGDKPAVEPAEYIVPVTQKLLGKKLKDIPLDDLTSTINWYGDKIASGSKFGPKHMEFLEYATKFLEDSTMAQVAPEADPHGDGVPF